MFSIILKRSATALGAVAVLAAAAPASAQRHDWGGMAVTASAAIDRRDANGWPDGTQHNSVLAAKVTVPDIKVNVSLWSGVAPSLFGGGLSWENF